MPYNFNQQDYIIDPITGRPMAAPATPSTASPNPMMAMMNTNPTVAETPVVHGAGSGDAGSSVAAGAKLASQGLDGAGKKTGGGTSAQDWMAAGASVAGDVTAMLASSSGKYNAAQKGKTIAGGAGAVIGGIFGGPVGAQIGQMAGSFIGGTVGGAFDKKHMREDYDTTTNKHFGSLRIQPNINPYGNYMKQGGYISNDEPLEISDGIIDQYLKESDREVAEAGFQGVDMNDPVAAAFARSGLYVKPSRRSVATPIKHYNPAAINAQFAGCGCLVGSKMKKGGFATDTKYAKGGLTPNKARKILHDGTVKGHPLTERQRKFFGAMSEGNTMNYAEGGIVEDPDPGGLWKTNRKGFVDSTLNANRNLDFVKRLYDPNTPSIQVPGKPGRSTHLMSYDPGSRRVYPEVVNKGGQLVHLQGDDAWNYANDNKEFIEFKTPGQAKWFAGNGYKTGTGVLPKFAAGGVAGPGDPPKKKPLTEQERMGVVNYMNTLPKQTQTSTVKPQINIDPSKVITAGDPYKKDRLMNKIMNEENQYAVQTGNVAEAKRTREEDARIKSEREQALEIMPDLRRGAPVAMRLPFTFPTGESKNWYDMDDREKAYVTGRRMGAVRANNWTDWINPGVLMSDAGEGIKTASYMARMNNSNMPYVTGYGMPIATLVGGEIAGQAAGKVVGPLIKAAGKEFTESAIGRNMYRLNPWAFKPNAGAYYRGIGKSGFDDAMESGVLRSKNQTGWGETVHTTSQFPVAKQYSNDWLPTEYVPDESGFGLTVKDGPPPAGFSDKSYIAEIPRTELTNPNSPEPWALAGPKRSFHQFINEKPIPIDNVNFLKEHWWKGYKEVPKVRTTSPEFPVQEVGPGRTIQTVRGPIDLQPAIRASQDNPKFDLNLYTTSGGPDKPGMPLTTEMTPREVQLPWSMQEFPGLHLQSTMRGGPISKIVEPKTGLINTEQALGIIGKESSGTEKVHIVRNALGNKIPAKMDYNDFRRTVQDALVPLETQLGTHKSNYGLGKLGFPSAKRSSFDEALANTEENIAKVQEKIKATSTMERPWVYGTGKHHYQFKDSYGYNDMYRTEPEALAAQKKALASLDSELQALQEHKERMHANINELPLENKTLILGNKSGFGVGSGSHDNPPETLGHMHFFIDKEAPDVLHMTQSQSDAFQDMIIHGSPERDAKHLSAAKTSLEFAEDAFKTATESGPNHYKFADGVTQTKKEVHAYLQKLRDQVNILETAKPDYLQKVLLHKQHQGRFLQEFVNYAGNRGDINKIRVPTSETAAKVQAYNKAPVAKFRNVEELPAYQTLVENQKIAKAKYEANPNSTEALSDYNEANRLASMGRHNPEAMFPHAYEMKHPDTQQTILKKYAEQPKLIKKLLNTDVKTVTDRKGNTWYEFDLPESAKTGKFELRAFDEGGLVMSNTYAKGGWIKKAVNPAHKGYCTPMTKSTCTPRRKAFARTMKKHHGFHEEGGMTMRNPIEDIMYEDMPYMAEGGETAMAEMQSPNPAEEQQEGAQQPQQQQGPQKTLINIEKGELLIDPMDSELGVVREYDNPNRYSPHKKDPQKEPIGNFTMVDEGMVVIPKDYAARYKKGDILTRKSIIGEILKDQMNNPEQNAPRTGNSGGAEYAATGMMAGEDPGPYKYMPGVGWVPNSKNAVAAPVGFGPGGPGTKAPAPVYSIEDSAVAGLPQFPDNAENAAGNAIWNTDFTPPQRPANPTAATTATAATPSPKKNWSLIAARAAGFLPTAYGITNALGNDPYLHYDENYGLNDAISYAEGMETNPNMEASRASLNQALATQNRVLNNIGSPSVRSEAGVNRAGLLKSFGELSQQGSNMAMEMRNKKRETLMNLKATQGAGRLDMRQKLMESLREDSANRQSLVHQGLAEGATNYQQSVMDEERIKSINTMAEFYQVDPYTASLLLDQHNFMPSVMDRLSSLSGHPGGALDRTPNKELQNSTRRRKTANG